MLPDFPKSGFKLIKKTPVPAVSGITTITSTPTTLFDGLALVDDFTTKTSTIFTEKGIVRDESYIIYLDLDDPAVPQLSKKDLQNLVGYINTTKLHTDQAYNPNIDSLELQIKGIAYRNALDLNHIELLCTI